MSDFLKELNKTAQEKRGKRLKRPLREILENRKSTITEVKAAKCETTIHNPSIVEEKSAFKKPRIKFLGLSDAYLQSNNEELSSSAESLWKKAVKTVELQKVKEQKERTRVRQQRRRKIKAREAKHDSKLETTTEEFEENLLNVATKGVLKIFSLVVDQK